jgi:hypothetical protein
MPRLFLSQAIVTDWVGGGRVALEGDLLRLPGAGALYLSPAVYFERIDGAQPDAYALVGSVKSAGELSQMGAEHYDTSVVLADQSYTVRPGYLATPVGEGGLETVLDGAAWGRMLSAIGALSSGRM